MKIYNPDVIKHPQQTENKKQPQQGEIRGESFQDILNAATDAPVSNSRDISAPQSVHPLDIPTAIGLSKTQEQAIAKGEEILGLLNHLSKLYNEIDGADSSLNSVANALDHSIRELQALKESLEQDDPLQPTLDQIGILSIVEKIKITRGDYT